MGVPEDPVLEGDAGRREPAAVGHRLVQLRLQAANMHAQLQSCTVYNYILIAYGGGAADSAVGHSLVQLLPGDIFSNQCDFRGARLPCLRLAKSSLPRGAIRPNSASNQKLDPLRLSRPRSEAGMILQ